VDTDVYGFFSDEFKSVIETLKPHSDKIKVVLNKADSISNQQLMRVQVQSWRWHVQRSQFHLPVDTVL
jgi:GTP-binding protein EngB required for normal cell division